MTFEEILPQVKAGKKVIRQGWGGPELYVKLVGETEHDGERLNPYFFNKCRGGRLHHVQPNRLRHSC
nr:hypothetical protein BN993_01243 [Virgibacillus halodenitrificans]